MDWKKTALYILLFINLFASLIFMFQTQNKEFAFILFITICILLLLFMEKTKDYILDPIKNYALWYRTDAGQISGAPDPRSMAYSHNYHWRISDVFPLGGYWRFTFISKSGKREYLNLQCAPITWNPDKDVFYNNVIKFATPKIEPRSPSQEYIRDKNMGYFRKNDPKDVKKSFKDTFGYDPTKVRHRRHNYAE